MWLIFSVLFYGSQASSAPTQSLDTVHALLPFSEQDPPSPYEFRVGRSGFHRKAIDAKNQTVLHFDKTTAVLPVKNVDALLANKTELFSVLLHYGCDRPLHNMFDKGHGKVPYYLTDNSMSRDEIRTVHEAAFTKYRFSLITCTETDRVSQALVDAISLHTVPIYNGFFEMSSMLANGVAAWREGPEFDMEVLLERVTELNENIKFLWSYQQILQEVIYYRYGSPLPIRLAYMRIWTEALLWARLAIVGIYSAKANSKLRNAIRETWGQNIRNSGVELLFFLSKLDDTDKALVSESDQFRDMIFLSVKEGYKNNSRKGLLFLQWMSANRKGIQFVIKTDDDIYFRPEPLLEQLQYRIPAGYIWGFIDYISPVPRSVSSPFYNSPEMYPFSTFPTYPRGVVRVLSMDIVHKVAKRAAAKTLRMVYGDDPSLGVHLRQMVLTHELATLWMDDFGSYSRFAMEPTCSKTWSSFKNETWVVHHVDAEKIRCMHLADLSGAKYENFCDCLDD